MSDTQSRKSGLLTGKLVPILTGLLIIAAFAIGSLYTQVKMLKTGTVPTQAQGATDTNQPNTLPAQAPEAKKGSASVDDDPVLGDESAPVTMIEFSDYECPFCKRHFDDTLGQLIADYVDTGKLKIVYRDLPLSFHDPMATKEAVAANCAREQGGDSKYFEYHDEIFTRTTSNGNGLSESDLTTIATDLGLNLESFNTCLADPDQEAEVKKDVADAGAAGATGTPTFVIGKSNASGKIDGELVVGAQHYEVFQAVIDSLLE